MIMGGKGGFKRKVSFPNMLISCLEGGPEVNQVSAAEFNVREGPKMYIRLRDYDFRGFELPEDSGLAAISQ